MPNIQGSQTYDNLAAAFAGESMARNKYTFYASQAKKEGYEQIAAIFELTAENEKEHAKLWYKFMENGIADTMTNLKLAAEGEHFEWSSMYSDFEKVAKKEGFDFIANKFAGVGAVEKEHEERYLALLKNLETGKVFKKDVQEAWICRNCGHVHTGTEAPGICPVCDHPQSYFELLAKNY